MDCNVYEAEKIVLTCTISSEGTSNSKIDLYQDLNDIIIKWYYNNGTEHELTMGTSDTRREGGNLTDGIPITSTLAISAIPGQHNAANLAQGSYYCRVHVPSRRDTVSNSSQPFTVVNQDAYFQFATSCRERNFIASRDSPCSIVIVENPTTTTDNITTTDLTTVTYQIKEDTLIMTSLHESVQSTPRQSQLSPDQNGIQIYFILVALLASVFAIIIIIMTIVLAIFCARKSKAKKMAKNINDCELHINLDHMHVL